MPQEPNNIILQRKTLVFLYLHDSSIDENTDVICAPIIFIVCRHTGRGNIWVARPHEIFICLLDLLLCSSRRLQGAPLSLSASRLRE